jgi:hypothetical protein
VTMPRRTGSGVRIQSSETSSWDEFWVDRPEMVCLYVRPAGKAGPRNPLLVLRARNSSITIATFPGERS